MLRLFFLPLLLLIFAGCASTPQSSGYDSNKDARIRVFHGTGVYLHPDKTCFSRWKTDAIHAAVGGFSMIVPNKKIGMPTTGDMPWSYSEYVIPAKKPLTIEMLFDVQGAGGSQRCGPIGVTFIPQAGHDYDTKMDVSARSCSIVLRELIPDAATHAEAQSTPSFPAKFCDAS